MILTLDSLPSESAHPYVRGCRAIVVFVTVIHSALPRKRENRLRHCERRKDRMEQGRKGENPAQSLQEKCLRGEMQDDWMVSTKQQIGEKERFGTATGVEGNVPS